MANRTGSGGARRALGIIGILLVAGTLAAGPGAQEPQGPPPGVTAGFPDLVTALRGIEGCLGVETARTASGKNVIFAWFENKAAVLRWYYSETHQQAMKTFFPGQTPGTPMPEIPDDSGPILAIAPITLADQPRLQEPSLPVSQIAIELYSPITEGLLLGSRFAPDGVRVKTLKDVTPGR